MVIATLLAAAALASTSLAGPSRPTAWSQDTLQVVQSYSSATVAACCRSMAEFAGDPAFIAAHLPPDPNAPAPLDGKLITFSTPYGSLHGSPVGQGWYIAPKPGSQVAIVMCHEYWGLNHQIEEAAQKLHDDTGYAVLAVDLYDGQSTTDPSQAGKLMANVDEQRCAAILAGALKALETGKGTAKAKEIGTVGYCFGGGWSERAAIIGSSHVQACVVYYGMPDMRPSSLARLKAPVMMFQAGRDRWINDTVVGQFKGAMKKAGRSLQVFKYDAVHAFANPSNPKYDASASADAYRRELSFFKAHL